MHHHPPPVEMTTRKFAMQARIDPTPALQHAAACIALASTLLSGCASPDGLSVHATATAVERLAARQTLSGVPLSATSWPQNDWWTGYGDEQLNRLMLAALHDQPDLRVASARLRQAQAVAGGVEARLGPQVTANLKSTTQRFSENSIYPKNLAGKVRSIDGGEIDIAQELDFWGRNRAALDAALDRAHVAEVEAQASRLVLTTTLARTYLQLDTAYARRDLAESTLRQREEILALVRRRVAVQLDSQLELTQAEAALPAVRAQLASIDESIALAGSQLAALQGQGPDAALVVERPHLKAAEVVQLPSALPAELLGRRPDIVAARWRVEASSRDIDVARAGFYPNVSLNAFAGYQSIGLGDFLTAGSRMIGVSPTVSLPIFDSGRLRANLDLQQGQYDAAVETYNGALVNALHDVAAQLVSLKWVDAEMDQQRQGLALARRAFDLARERYRIGVAGYLNVLSAESALLLQQRQLVDAEGRRRELQLSLIRALGGGYVPAASPAPRRAS
ncbi:MAG: efflux transporter outer membrane subunit [Burkholderiales bacterium]